MYNCEDIFEKTDAYLDGELSDIEYAEFKKHLESCEACKNNVEYAKKLNGVMQGMPSVEPPADFLEALHKKIASEGKAVRFYKKWQPYGALAACFVLAVVLGTNAVNDLNETTDYLQASTPMPVTDTVSEKTANQTADTQVTDTVINAELTATAQPTAVTSAPTAVPKAEQSNISSTAVPEISVSVAEKTDVNVKTAEPAQASVAVSVSSAPTMLPSQGQAVETADMPAVASLSVIESNELQADEVTVMQENSVSKRLSGGSGGGSSSAVASTALSAPTVSTAVNYISSYNKEETEEILSSLGIQKFNGEYVTSQEKFEQFKTKLEEKDIAFDGVYTSVDDKVRFVIEWE